MTAQEIKTWRERVERANANDGKFTERDREDAGYWNTCAVGEQHAKHPLIVLAIYRELAEPLDPVLYSLGGSFDTAVYTNNVLRAYELLDRIEARVMELA